MPSAGLRLKNRPLSQRMHREKCRPLVRLASGAPVFANGAVTAAMAYAFSNVSRASNDGMSSSEFLAYESDEANQLLSTDATMVRVGGLFGDPNGEPFVADDSLPEGSRDILAGHRSLDASGKVILHFPEDDFHAVPARRGGGFFLIRRGQNYPVPGRNPTNAVRVQPAGTGSVDFNPSGYYVVYNNAGQPISPYSGRTVPIPRSHNPIGIMVPPNNNF